MTERLTRGEVDTVADRIRVEGWCDRGYDDEFELNSYGFRVNVGRVRAENKLRAAAKNRLGRKVVAKSFPFKTHSTYDPAQDGPHPGGIVVVALPEKADEVFASYGEGFYS